VVSQNQIPNSNKLSTYHLDTPHQPPITMLTNATFQYLNQTPDTGMTFVFIAFASIAIYSTLPLTIRLLTTLKRRRGLYFWSVLLTSWGLCIRQIGILTSFLARGCPWVLRLLLAQVGWVMMVSGFSLVLYSRLSIIVADRRVRMGVLGMIIVNGLVWHTAMTTIATGKAKERYAGDKANLPGWEHVDYYFERTQIVVFSSQETVISGLYIWAAWKYLKSGFTHKGKKRGIMMALVMVQVTIIAVDVAIIVIDFLGYLQLKLFINSFVYAVKLELEMVVLNQLVELSRLGLSETPEKTGVTDDDTGRFDSAVMLAKPSPVASADSLDLESQRSRGSKASYSSMEFITMPEGIR
jgi:hypothetical protein